MLFKRRASGMREDCADDEKMAPITRMSDNVLGQPFTDAPNGREDYRIACVTANVPPVSQVSPQKCCQTLNARHSGLPAVFVRHRKRNAFFGALWNGPSWTAGTRDCLASNTLSHDCQNAKRLNAQFRSKLEHLNLADNNLHGPCLGQLFEALEKNKTVRVLDISLNRISADVVSSFERYLTNQVHSTPLQKRISSLQQCSLTCLNLSATQLDDRSGARLCRSLKDGHLKLQSLNLSRNTLSNRTALALSHYLEVL